MLVWDENKNKKLIIERGISFEDIADKIMNGDILEILMHTRRDNQKIFVISINEYTYAVPFTEDNENIFLKTAYPSRKLHAKYGEKT